MNITIRLERVAITAPLSRAVLVQAVSKKTQQLKEKDIELS